MEECFEAVQPVGIHGRKRSKSNFLLEAVLGVFKVARSSPGA